MLYVRFVGEAVPDWPISPRRYTLTHSDFTGDLFLTIGTEYDLSQISGLYTRLMRDEVLAEWSVSPAPALDVFVHVSGGFVLGSAEWRNRILCREMPHVLRSFRMGDSGLYDAYPEMERVPVWVHFEAAESLLNRVESYGSLVDYR